MSVAIGPRLAVAGTLALWSAGASGFAAAGRFRPDRPNDLEFPPRAARFVRLVIHDAPAAQPCIDELEVYGPASKENLALASRGAVATASSCLPGYAIHRVSHLNDGRYGNSWSWIAAGTRGEWAQIEFPAVAPVAKVVISRDREGRYRDRLPGRIEVRLSLDGAEWTTVATGNVAPSLPSEPVSEEELLRRAFECEELSMSEVDPSDPVERVLRQLAALVERFAARGIEVARERVDLDSLRREAAARGSGEPTLGATGPGTLFFRARLAKRRLFLRDPDLEPLRRVLFVKRHPYVPSHNYSVLLDAAGGPGGAICVLEVPRREGRLEPGEARVVTLFDARDGTARDPVASFDGEEIWFSCRRAGDDYYRLHRMRADGSDVRVLSRGPFHDTFPCPLPDGGLAFMSTRCRARFLCWRPQAFVLFRMERDGSGIRPLSHANLSEWTPSVMRDGRLLWMRSEYIDKGADFGHTLWAIHPDGTQPRLVYGNDTRNCYAGGREVPGRRELLCTLVSHGGDLNGPIALIDLDRGPFDPSAITNITPDVAPRYHMDWAREACFRDPYPLSRDLFLVSHAPRRRFGLWVIDRGGNRELLHFDPAIGSFSPTPLRRVDPPPVLSRARGDGAEGVFVVEDVYRGLEGSVERGTVRYIRVCQELRADLERLADGRYRRDHPDFQDWYATPVHKVSGPNGWPSYVAKADLGLAPVEADGSASFRAPAGKVLYFEVLDENFVELQRMRSVVQLQPGERRGCIGCHEHRASAPPPRSRRSVPLALRRAPSRLVAPPWGGGPFSYEEVVQPVWNRRCVGCHSSRASAAVAASPDLSGELDRDGVPASYRSLIEGAWVHYFDCRWAEEHHLAAPGSFGTLRSRIWPLLEGRHHGVSLSAQDVRRVRCWTDLNCPLWPDYLHRTERPGVRVAAAPGG